MRYSDMVLWNIGNIYIQNGNYSQYLRTLCTMGPLCHAWLFFPSSLLLHKAVASSSAGDQLFILFPALRARTSPIPPTWVDPISLRLQAPSHFSVKHKYLHIKKFNNNTLLNSFQVYYSPSWEHRCTQSAMGRWIDTDSIDRYYRSILLVWFSSMLSIHR